MGFSRVLRAGYWIAPPLFCLFVYWFGLKAWFQQDDFAWLSLRLEITTWQDFLQALFWPKAQGTIRPLSERLFFIVFWSLFGLDALPFRIWVFLTQFANLALLTAITVRLTGSRVAGFCAAIFWIANSGLAKVMSWTSAYNQALCGFFLLSSFFLLLRYVETGKRRYWVGQWITFLLGFGALELNVLYPVLAAGYALCCARSCFRKTLPLFVASALYLLVRHWAAPISPAGAYSLYLDRSLLATLANYWAWTLTAAFLRPAWLMWALASLLTLALGAFAFSQARRGQWGPVFLLGWFLVLIAPVLPFRAHLTEYYASLPALGLAMLAAWAFSWALRGPRRFKIAAVLLAGAYLAASLPVARSSSHWNYYRSRMVRGLVRGVARAHQLHPGKVILLVGVDSDLFWAGVFHKPFRLVGARSVFLAPGSEAGIEPHPEFGNVSDFVLPPGVALKAIEKAQALIYAVAGDRLWNVTSVYADFAKSEWSDEEPRQIDAAQPIFAPHLGPTWYAIQGRHRWMPKLATVQLGGPRRAGEKLYLSGYCPASQFGHGPVKMTVSVDGRVLPPVLLSRPDSRFDFTFLLPADLVGKKSVLVTVEVDRTFRVPDEDRDLGAVFGTFAIR